MTIDMSQFYEVFFEETEEHLAEMEALLLALDTASPDSEEMNAIFRAAHSIKGSSGTFGFNDLAEVTHVLENLLDRLRRRELQLTRQMVDAFLAAGDILKAMLAAHRKLGPALAASAVAETCARLRALTAAAPAENSPPERTPEAAPETPAPSVTAPAKVWRIEFVPTPAASADPAALDHFLRDLAEFGELTILAQPAAGDPGFWHLRLASAAPEEAIGELIDFIAERDAWRLQAEGAASAAAPPADDASFGFFAPLPAVDANTAANATANAEDNAAANSNSDLLLEEGEGFGFFAPPPAAPAAAAPQAEQATAGSAENAAADAGEGRDFGFFQPLTPPPEVAAAAPPADAAPPARVAAGSETASIRVSVERADQLINLVGELVITQAMLLQCAEKLGDAAPEALSSGLVQLERNTRSLQEAVMSIRMMPISFVFSRFPRLVRDLSAKLGKAVELKMSGEATELDKGLIERIADPLTHLVRNSLDHGIETPEKRRLAGKGERGTITLKAAHQGGNIVIEVGDDGAGLQREKILARARERGIKTPETMSDQEVWGLIFEAGFSTAETVTDVSGRGVGMDVVRRNIQAMGGRIEIESMFGIGTRITVRLPLTLAILDGMSVAVGEETYILPLSSVIESLQPEAGDVKTVAGEGRLLKVRGDYLPVLVLHELFAVAGGESDFTRGIAIVLDADGSRAALFVDTLVGQHQVVIKSLEQNYRRVAGISGATIMGDGRVAMILDVAALIALARQAPPRHSLTTTAGQPGDEHAR